MDDIITISIIVAVAVGLAVWYFNSDSRFRSKLYKTIDTNGIKAEARILKINRFDPTPTMIFLEWTLEVNHPNGTKYEVSKNIIDGNAQFWVLAAYAHYIGKIDTMVPIEIHPNMPEVIRIDRGRLGEYSLMK